MRIPDSEFLNFKGTFGVTDRLLKKYHSPLEIERFQEWMCGQTCSVMNDDTPLYHAWDYEKWLDQEMPSNPTDTDLVD